MTDSTPFDRADGPVAEREAAATRKVALLQEILEYQRRLNRLASLKSSSDEHYLVEAYQRAIQRRRLKLAAIPGPVEAVPDPWR